MKALRENEIVDVLRVMMPDEDEDGGYEWELMVGQFAEKLGTDFETFLTKCQR